MYSTKHSCGRITSKNFDSISGMDRKSTDRIGHKNEDLREILEKEREQRERGIIERENRREKKRKMAKTG